MLEGVDGLDAQEPDTTDALKTKGEPEEVEAVSEADLVSPEAGAAVADEDPDDLDAPVPESSSGGYANWWV